VLDLDGRGRAEQDAQHIDYGAPNESRILDLFMEYDPIRTHGRQIHPKPGDRLPMTDVDVDFVSAGGATLSRSAEFRRCLHRKPRTGQDLISTTHVSDVELNQ
jgi:hypothetical protein